MVKQKLFLTASIVLLNGTTCSNIISQDLGVKNGKFLPCPASPNCVSSQSEDDRHKIEPLHYTISFQEAQEKLLSILGSMKRTRVIAADGNYIHATCTSFLFRFVDDIEFNIDDPTKTIHIRSASRLGYYDFGVNRRRVDEIRKHFSVR